MVRLRLRGSLHSRLSEHPGQSIDVAMADRFVGLVLVSKLCRHVLDISVLMRVLL